MLGKLSLRGGSQPHFFASANTYLCEFLYPGLYIEWVAHCESDHLRGGGELVGG